MFSHNSTNILIKKTTRHSFLLLLQLLVCVNASVRLHIQIIWWRRLASGAGIASRKPAGTVLLCASVFFDSVMRFG